MGGEKWKLPAEIVLEKLCNDGSTEIGQAAAGENGIKECVLKT